MMQPTKFWADVCRHVDLPELADDPRFATVESIAANTAEAVEILTKVIATRTLAEWSERFATLAGPWAPVQDTLQAADDAQIRANEYLVQRRRTRTGRQPRPVRRHGPAHRARARIRRADRRNPAGTGTRLGPHHRTQDGRRRHLGDRSR